MSGTGITDERIFELIAAYGADGNAWPEAERAAARRRMAEAPALFASALEEARSLDAALGGLAEIDVPASLRDALIASAPKPQQSAGRAGSGWMRFVPRWVPAGAFASLAMGLLIGVNVSLPASVATASTAEEEADAVMYAALGFDDYGALMDEITE